MCPADENSVNTWKLIVELSMRRSLVILLFVGAALIEALPMAMEEFEQVNPEETGDFFEGDMVLPPVITMRNGLATLTRRWPNGVVPYEIQDQFSPIELATIQVAMAEIHYYTCVRFVPRSNQTDYVSIVNSPTGCWSTVGRAGGRQVVNLQAPKCIRKPGTVMHELKHALGFLHEQNRSDRDDYVLIQYENILPKWLRNFKKYNNTQSFGMPYDYGSIMHYSSKAFSANGADTMVPTQYLGGLRMGQRKRLTALDIEKVNLMYNCDGNEDVGSAEESYLDQLETSS